MSDDLTTSTDEQTGSDVTSTPDTNDQTLAAEASADQTPTDSVDVSTATDAGDAGPAEAATSGVASEPGETGETADQTAGEAPAADLPAADAGAGGAVDADAGDTPTDVTETNDPAAADQKSDDDSAAAAASPGPTRPKGGPTRPGAGRPGAQRGPRPGARPGARPGPRPGAPRQRPAATELHIPVASDPTPWGRVDADGSVFVKDASAEGGERFVGSYPDASAEEALAYYGRKFDELASVVDLAEQRMAAPDANVKDITAGLQGLREKLTEAPVVGDLAGLAARLESLEGGLEAHREALDKARAQAREEARGRRLAMVEEAEKISGTDVKRMQWKQSADRMAVLFEDWKRAQREDTKLDKATEDELWHRFSHARTVFDRARRQHFSQLHAEHSQAKAAKEKLIAEAEALSGSTDWAGTSNAYRQLLERWKKAGRAGRKDDDALWARFRAAQDVFYAARGADNAKSDAEMTANLEVKEKLLVEAEALLPVKDLKAAKAALRSIQERWEGAGKVPRADMHRVERRLKAVEQAVRDREDERWRRSNPETKARTEGALGQLESAIAALEDDLAKAKAGGNAKRIAEAESALKARREWLQAVQRTARDFR